MSSLSAKERSRSPRFPSYPLNEAIGYAERIYDGVHRSAIDSATAFRLMGFAGRSGASATALGAVRQFGLIDGIGERTRISDLALRILEPASPAEKEAALIEAANQPNVFALMLERFDGRIPSADEPVRAFLIRELGFSKSGADDCIASMRKTFAYVSDIPEVTQREETESRNSSDGNNDSKAADAQVESRMEATDSNALQRIRIPLTKECAAELSFVGTPSERAIVKLIKHIELMKEVWSEN